MAQIWSHLGKQKIMTRTHAFGYTQNSVTFDHIFLLLVFSELEMSLNHESKHSEILACLGIGQISAHYLMPRVGLFIICCAEISCHKLAPFVFLEHVQHHWNSRREPSKRTRHKPSMSKEVLHHTLKLSDSNWVLIYMLDLISHSLHIN